ncbi:MAG TPA: GNAT family N-acetyltransferase [Chloroflexota bacterium]
MPGDLDLMRLQAATLYLLDEQGRMVALNEAARPAAPRVFLGRTPEGNVWHVRRDLPPDLAGQLGDLLAAEPVADDLLAAGSAGRPAEPRCLPALWAALAPAAPVEREWRGPAYLIPPGAAAPAALPLLELAEGDRGLLAPPFEWLAAELAERAPCLAAVEGGRAVAVCFCSRRGDGAAEAGVETAPEQRGRGLASAAAAAWAAAVRGRGLLPLYSTGWDNLASRGVARRLGARLYGEDLSLT